MHGGRTPANRLVDPDIQPWFTAYIFGMGSPFMLWSVDTCQSKVHVSSDQYHMIISQAQVLTSWRSQDFCHLSPRHKGVLGIRHLVVSLFHRSNFLQRVQVMQ